MRREAPVSRAVRATGVVLLLSLAAALGRLSAPERRADVYPPAQADDAGVAASPDRRIRPAAPAGSAGPRRSWAPPRDGAPAAASGRVSSARPRHLATATTPSRAVEPAAAAGEARRTREPSSSDAAHVAEAVDDRTPRAGLSGVVVEHDGARVGLLPVLARALSAGGPAGEHRALTDGTGAFAFPHLPDGDYLVRTEDTDLYDSATATVRASAGALVIVVERKPFEWIELRGTVRSPRGAIGGARIDVLGQEAPGAVSSDAGAFAMRVPASRRAMAAALRVRRSGFRERQVPLSSAQQLSDREWVLDVSLDPLSAVVPVTGRVSGEDGRPVERATVQLESAARRQAYRAMTDAAGRFQIAAVETGSDYRLWVRPRATYKDALREPVTIEEGGTPLDVVLHPLATTTLTARVVALDGSPVPNFTLTLTSAYGSAARALEARTGADGRLRVEDLPEGPLALATRAAPRLSISGVVLAADATRELTLPIDVGSHRVEGRVVSADGTPIGGAVLSMQWSSSFDGIVSRSSRETVTTDDGRFVFSHLGPGVRVIAVRAQGFAPAHVQHVTGTSPGALDIRIARTRNWEEE